MAFVPGVGLALTTATGARALPALCRQHSPQHAATRTVPNMEATSGGGGGVQRRHSRRVMLVGAAAAAAAAGLTLVPPARAGDLQPYKDIAKGFSIMRPTAWNEFDASEGQYDVKWQDIIQPLEFVTVLTSPVSKGKTIQSVGSVDAVGEKVASSRGGQLVAAAETAIEGIPAYVFEIKKGPAHQITLLTITKNKLYSVNASASEQRWTRRQKLLRSVVESFHPKL
jgi:photosystem II oxygen-evolving enhancer protein 2